MWIELVLILLILSVIGIIIHLNSIKFTIYNNLVENSGYITEYIESNKEDIVGLENRLEALENTIESLADNTVRLTGIINDIIMDLDAHIEQVDMLTGITTNLSEITRDMYESIKGEYDDGEGEELLN